MSEEETDESDVVEESPCHRWHKRKEEVSNICSVRVALCCCQLFRFVLAEADTVLNSLCCMLLIVFVSRFVAELSADVNESTRFVRVG